MQEVGGSIPPGSTNLRQRSLTKLSVREMAKVADEAHRAKAGRTSGYVCIQPDHPGKVTTKGPCRVATIVCSY